MSEREAPRLSAGVAFRTLGCKVNRADSEALAAELLGAGVPIAEEDAASVVVVNTCTVTGEADAKARKAVRQALGAAASPTVVVTGCLAALDREALSALGERVVVEADKARLGEVVRGLLASAGAGPAAAGTPAAAAEAFRTRVALKVEDGCDNFCAYCIVPYARGVPRATPLADVVGRCQALVSAGVREVVLTGINIGRYSDAETGAGLPELVAAVAASGIERVRLSSVEPPDLTPELLSVLSATPAFCAHLHVPLQSGCDATLSAMGRAYSTREFAEWVAAAREALPGLVVTTDVMAGFPGETDAQAAETRAFCERMGFGKLHVFRYSQRPSTPAAKRPDQVSPADKTARAGALRALSQRLEATHAAAALGSVGEVLVERVNVDARGESFAEGTTRDYLRVRFAARGVAEGEIAHVRLVQAQGAFVLGEGAC